MGCPRCGRCRKLCGVSPNRVEISGHSAGGHATMQALCEYPDVWTVGIAESSISDMQAMSNETHKFESQYLQQLCFEADSSRRRKTDYRRTKPYTLDSKHEGTHFDPLRRSGRDSTTQPGTSNGGKDSKRGGTVEVCVYEVKAISFRKVQVSRTWKLSRSMA